jgi:hypothetical protein
MYLHGRLPPVSAGLPLELSLDALDFLTGALVDGPLVVDLKDWAEYLTTIIMPGNVPIIQIARR